VDSDIRLWDTASGKEIRRLGGHRAWVGGLVFWPDGKKLASASADQTIRVWDLRDVANVPTPRILRGHNLEVWRLALLPDAKTLVSGSKDGSVYLWDATAMDGRLALTTLPEKVSAWVFTPDNRSLVALDPQGGVARWKGPNFQEKEPLVTVDPGFYGACISPDARLIALGTTNGEVRLWDLQARSLLRQTTVSTGPVLPLGFPGERNRLVMSYATEGSKNGRSFHEWDVTAWQETAAWRSPINSGWCALSPDGRWSLTYNAEGAGLLRAMATGEERGVNLEVREAGLGDQAFSPDGKLFAVVSSLGYGRVVETATFREVMRLRGFLMGLHSAAFSPEARRLAVGGDGAEAIKLWDTESRLDLLTLEGRGSLFRKTGFSPDGNVLGSANSQNVLHLWRAPSWEEIQAADRQP
jgi:WD40 repeat protein